MLTMDLLPLSDYDTGSGAVLFIAMAGTHQIWAHFLRDCKWRLETPVCTHYIHWDMVLGSSKIDALILLFCAASKQ